MSLRRIAQEEQYLLRNPAKVHTESRGSIIVGLQVSEDRQFLETCTGRRIQYYQSKQRNRIQFSALVGFARCVRVQNQTIFGFTLSSCPGVDQTGAVRDT
jgi:hypothetical protein